MVVTVAVITKGGIDSAEISDEAAMSKGVVDGAVRMSTAVAVALAVDGFAAESSCAVSDGKKTGKGPVAKGSSVAVFIGG